MRLLIIILLLPCFCKAQPFLTKRGSPPCGYLLDTITSAEYAFALRKISSSYSGNCLKVRRSSDNTEQDIGFVGDDLDTASIRTFVGANNGFVSVWYDQSGNGRNAVKITNANQPQIVASGVFKTFNGQKPAIEFANTGSPIFLVVGSSTGLDYNGTGMTLSLIIKENTIAVSNVKIAKGKAPFPLQKGFYQDGISLILMAATGATFVSGKRSTVANWPNYFHFFLSGATPSITAKVYQWNTLIATATSVKYASATADPVAVAAYDTTTIASNMKGVMCELISWPANKVTQEPYLFRNQNSYYSIY